MFQLVIRPISFFTTTKNLFRGLVLGIAAAACLALLGATGRGVAQQTGSVAKCVQRLGARGNNNFSDVKKLAETPETSTRLLIEALHPIPETRILASQNIPSAEHVLWSLRALRYITGGKDFCAPTAHKFGNSQIEQHRKYWLYFGHHNCVSFFAMWPSRGTEYIAPADAQRRIIRKWRNWFATYGSTFHYEPLQNPEPWQWAWW